MAERHGNMSVVLQVVVAAFCVLMLGYVVVLVARERLLLKYSLLWLVLCIVLLLVALFPQALFGLSAALGFETPVNFIYFIGFFCLMAIVLSLSVITSRQTMKIKNLTQRIAIVEYESRNEFADDRESHLKYNADAIDEHALCD